MPRRPKPKNTLSAGERAKLYEAELEERRRRIQADDNGCAQVEQNNRSEDVRKTSEAGAVENIPTTQPKILPKPQHATVKVDFSINTGEIGRMHGMCNGPLSYGTDISHLFREIGVPQVRFDKTDGSISSFAVDISRIFKDPDADPNDPQNYDFSYTDKYIAAAYDSGARVIYRLGESRDRLSSGKKIAIPVNIDLWINVCANIIRHYNDYFAGGYAFGIEYFEIWNHAYEDGDTDQTAEFEFYRRVASTVKIIDSRIKVGGMAFEGFDDAARDFLRYCRKTKAPIDFITLTSLASDPKSVSEAVNKAHSYAKNLGFDRIEVIVGEWCYVDSDLTDIKDRVAMLSSLKSEDIKVKKAIFDSQASIKGAAYAAAVMLGLNAKTEASMACFYDAQPMISPFTAICNRFGEPQKPFYAFKAYGELYRAGRGVLCESDQTEGFAHTGIYAGAAVADNGECYIMIASFGGCGVVDLRLDAIPDDLYTAEVYILDGVKDLTLGDSVPLSGVKKRMVINVSEYGVVLIKLY